MAPMLHAPSAGDGEGDSGVRRLPIDRPQTPPAIFGQPEPGLEIEEDFEVATNSERIKTLEGQMVEVIETGKSTQALAQSCVSNTGLLLGFMRERFGMPAPGTPATPATDVAAGGTGELGAAADGVGQALAASTGNQMFKLLGPVVRVAQKNSGIVAVGVLLYLHFVK